MQFDSADRPVPGLGNDDFGEIAQGVAVPNLNRPGFAGGSNS